MDSETDSEPMQTKEEEQDKDITMVEFPPSSKFPRQPLYKGRRGSKTAAGWSISRSISGMQKSWRRGKLQDLSFYAFELLLFDEIEDFGGQALYNNGLNRIRVSPEDLSPLEWRVTVLIEEQLRDIDFGRNLGNKMPRVERDRHVLMCIKALCHPGVKMQRVCSHLRAQCKTMATEEAPKKSEFKSIVSSIAGPKDLPFARDCVSRVDEAMHHGDARTACFWALKLIDARGESPKKKKADAGDSKQPVKKRWSKKENKDGVSLKGERRGAKDWGESKKTAVGGVKSAAEYLLWLLLYHRFSGAMMAYEDSARKSLHALRRLYARHSLDSTERFVYIFTAILQYIHRGRMQWHPRHLTELREAIVTSRAEARWARLRNHFGPRIHVPFYVDDMHTQEGRKRGADEREFALVGSLVSRPDQVMAELYAKDAETYLQSKLAIAASSSSGKKRSAPSDVKLPVSKKARHQEPPKDAKDAKQDQDGDIDMIGDQQPSQHTLSDLQALVKRVDWLACRVMHSDPILSVQHAEHDLFLEMQAQETTSNWKQAVVLLPSGHVLKGPYWPHKGETMQRLKDLFAWQDVFSGLGFYQPPTSVLLAANGSLWLKIKALYSPCSGQQWRVADRRDGNSVQIVDKIRIVDHASTGVLKANELTSEELVEWPAITSDIALCLSLRYVLGIGDTAPWNLLVPVDAPGKRKFSQGLVVSIDMEEKRRSGVDAKTGLVSLPEAKYASRSGISLGAAPSIDAWQQDVMRRWCALVCSRPTAIAAEYRPAYTAALTSSLFQTGWSKLSGDLLQRKPVALRTLFPSAEAQEWKFVVARVQQLSELWKIM